MAEVQDRAIANSGGECPKWDRDRPLHRTPPKDPVTLHEAILVVGQGECGCVVFFDLIGMESNQIRGVLGRQLSLLGDTKPGVPPLERAGEIAVEHIGTDLQQQMRTARRPPPMTRAVTFDGDSSCASLRLDESWRRLLKTRQCCCLSA